MFNEKEDVNRGGALIGNKGVRGDTKAALTVGLGNISQNDFQQLTNDLYAGFIKDLTSKGLELVSPERAGSTEAYKKYERLEKVAPSMAEQIGFMTIYPSDIIFYIKGLDRQGKVK